VVVGIASCPIGGYNKREEKNADERIESKNAQADEFASFDDDPQKTNA